jgi:chromosome segregation ATPase
MAIKVKVNFKHPTVMMTQEKYDSYMKEYEKLLQENKDLRVHVGHLRDELNLSRQQSEARRQVICERDKLIQELNEEIQASNDELENVQCDLVDHVKLQEQMCDTIDDLRIKLAKSESESSQGMNAMVKFWEEAVTEKNKTEERAEEYRIALMESDCRVDELEKQLAWMREEVARLTNERDTAVNGNAELIEENAELRDNLDAVINIKNEYAETIGEMHKKIVAMQSPEFTSNLAKLIIANLPSTDK